MSVLIDLTGKRYGRLTVLRREGTYQRPSGNKEPTWRCVCDCGHEVVVTGSNLKRDTNSCGCLQAEKRFGAKRETEYRVDGEVAYVTAYDGSEIIINTCDLDDVLKHRWRINLGYATSEKSVPMHRMLMKPPSSMDVHHINENKLDNRRSNLLMMTRAEHTSLHQKSRIANGVTIQQWIPVTERLPERDVLAYYTIKHAGDRENGMGFTGVLSYVCFDPTPHWQHEGCGIEVTHWMPLPTPPKGE